MPQSEGLTLEQAQKLGFKSQDSGGLSLEQAQALGFKPQDDLAAIRTAQAAAFPTAAELGGKPGKVAPSPEYQGIVGKLAQLGHILADTEPGAITGNEPTSIPGLDFLRNALGTAIPGGPGVTSALPLVEQIKASPLGQAAIAAKNAVVNKFDPARIFNEVAGVPAGSKGVQVSKQTGEIITNPGNAPVRVLQSEGKGTLGTIKEALTAKPTPELQVRVYGEMQNAGKALEGQLAPSKAVLVVDVPQTKKAGEALKAAGLDKFLVNDNTQALLSPLEAQQFRSELGQRINWRDAAAPTEANDLLKDAWKAISKQIDDAVPGIGPFNKRWQEAYRYSNALAHRLEGIAKGNPVPLSAAAKTAVKVAKGAGVATGTGTLLGGLYEVLRRLD